MGTFFSFNPFESFMIGVVFGGVGIALFVLAWLGWLDQQVADLEDQCNEFGHRLVDLTTERDRLRKVIKSAYDARGDQGEVLKILQKELG